MIWYAQGDFPGRDRFMAGYLKTSDIAKIVGVHVNTVRLYEDKGFLSPVPRSKSGYRLFTPLHLEQMRIELVPIQWKKT